MANSQASIHTLKISPHHWVIRTVRIALMLWYDTKTKQFTWAIDTGHAIIAITTAIALLSAQNLAWLWTKNWCISKIRGLVVLQSANVGGLSGHKAVQKRPHLSHPEPKTSRRILYRSMGWRFVCVCVCVCACVRASVSGETASIEQIASKIQNKSC